MILTDFSKEPQFKYLLFEKKFIGLNSLALTKYIIGNLKIYLI